jgi:hypothetical protein
MHETKYVVFGATRAYGDQATNEVYWNGKVGHTVTRLVTRKLMDAALFSTAREAYAAVGALINVGHLPYEFLDSRVGKRMVTDD